MTQRQNLGIAPVAAGEQQTNTSQHKPNNERKRPKHDREPYRPISEPLTSTDASSARSPEEVHATLRRCAAAAGMSLQEYLLGRLTEDASSPTLEEVFDRAGGRAGGRAPLRSAVWAVRAERDAR